jgi:hypothetical protein
MTEQGKRSFEGPFFFAVFTLLFCVGAYAMWPADFFAIPFSEISAASLLRAVASIMMAILALEFLSACTITTLSDN